MTRISVLRSSRLPQAIFFGKSDVPEILRHVLGLVKSSRLLQAPFFRKKMAFLELYDTY